MAFGKTEPKEIIGMEPDELKAKLDKIDAFEARFGAIEAQTKTGFDGILSRLDGMKPKAEPTPVVDPDISFLENPSASLDARLHPLSQQTTDNTIMLRHRDARERFPKDFERWGNEIVSVMKDASPEQQMNPKSWEMAVKIVRGEHAADIEKDGAQGNYGYLEPVSAGLRSEKPADGLSNAQREMVKTLAPFGITAEKYNNGQKRLDKSRAERLGRFASVDNG